jgi:hypothetical protein
VSLGLLYLRKYAKTIIISQVTYTLTYLLPWIVFLKFVNSGFWIPQNNVSNAFYVHIIEIGAWVYLICLNVVLLMYENKVRMSKVL